MREKEGPAENESIYRAEGKGFTNDGPFTDLVKSGRCQLDSWVGLVGWLTLTLSHFTPLHGPIYYIII